ncbi:hypothetical protein H2199_001945 [Coniosporium tulheliwenetii]|uniref:Uncharacterized protein n=1 Tax=Coniosporium tulheliwenetii TaxID=3383036 RepID=A0ACC2ZKU4_9PEZI|nr:hypothetical protein H2199_001945 [Cladosporium sp. JES 115]
MAELLESLFNHVALPPRLPGKQDTRIEQIEQALTVRISDASRALGDFTNEKFRDQWNCIRRSLQACKTVNAGGKVSKTSLLAELRGLERRDLLIVHVTEQNAGLLVRRDTGAQGEIVVFEAFEASPLSARVLASETALQWDFSGCAVAIPLSEFMDSSFQDSLATFLEQASTESIKHFAARTNKAGSSIFESRGTADPSLITQMLMTLLEVNGYRLSPTLLRKRVRDDVCWTDGAEKPWRRCPFWLVLRVGIQRHLCTQLGEVGRVLYKFLICLVLAHLLDDALGHLTPESLTFLKSKLYRRLVKLEVDKDRASPSSRTVYNYMFTILRPVFSKTVQNATERIGASWSDCKKAMRRPVLPIPYRADQRDLYLTLPNSESYLQQILTNPLYGPSGPTRVFQLPREYDVSSRTTNTLRGFAHRYFALSEMEEDMERSRTAIEGMETSSHGQCIYLARQIDTYLNTVADTYDTNPEQKSVMLLTVMELWVMMDECAVKSFKLLENHNPGFPPEILDVLQLSQLQDLIRLQKIQNHLQERRKKCEHTRCTIFDDPTKGCFAERFFDESEKLQRLQQRIETAAELSPFREGARMAAVECTV